ncbi:hypothetical protein GCM10027059_25800 [Myceligenerans halotolerans]
MALADKIKRARRLVAFYPDLAVAAQIETAESELAAARKKYRASENSTAVRKATKVVAELKEAAAATVLEVELEALRRKEWAELEASNPPRTDKTADKAFRINWDTFVAEAWPKCVIAVRYRDSHEPVEVAATEWGPVLEEISDGTYQVFGMALLELNRGSSDPF